MAREFCIIGRFNGPEPLKQRKRRQNRGHALAEEGGPRHACHAHLKGRHKQNIQADVAQRRGNEEIERRLGIPQRRENSRADVIEEEKDQSPDIDLQIELCIAEDISRRVERLHEGAG